MSDADVSRLYERWLYELWPSADRALADELVTPEFVGHWPDQDVHGAAGLVAMIEQSLALFADITTSIDVGPIVDGDLVAARWTFRGTYQGGMPGATAVGTSATLRGADVFRVSHGRLSEYWVSSDVEQLTAQLVAA